MKKEFKRIVMKKFFVSKSDKNKFDFIIKSIDEIKPDRVYILCENSRQKVYEGIDALVLPLKDLNKADNWIEFAKTITKDSLLVIDNVLKFIYFGDGKKKYLKDLSQSIDNIIVTDVVPFYTEPAEIFYPFWFLGKEILGYNSYNSFKANHLEEKHDGSANLAHSFDVLKAKIKDYYIQDYDCFFKNRTIIEWSMTNENFQKYQQKKMTAISDFNNPIQMKTSFADFVNLLPEKANVIKPLIKGKTVIIINYLPYERKIRSFFEFEQFDILSFHEKDFNKFSKYDTLIFYDNIIVKPHNIFYLENYFFGNIFNLIETSAGIDKNLFNAVYSIGLRNEFDKHFGNGTKNL